MRSSRTSVRLAVPALLAAAIATAPAAIATDVASAAGSATNAATKPEPVPTDTGSYDVGLLMGSQLQHNGLAQKDLAVETLVRGLRDSLAGRVVTPEERDTASRFMREAHGALAEQNQAAARAFLEHNAVQPGVVSLPSGLQYRVLAAGDPAGASPQATDQVTVRYRASLADGTEVDRSETHDRPATFRVNAVFKGWQEALRLMKPGAKWLLFMPPELGYGTNSPPMVPPGSLLVYELELLRVEPGKATDALPPTRVKPAGAPKAPAPASH